MTSDAEIVVGIRGEVSGGKVVKRTLDDIEKSGARAKKGTKDLQDQFTRTDGTAKLLANTMRVLGVSFGLRQLQQTVDTYTNMQNRLKLVTGSASELVGVTNELFQISNDTRQAFESTAEVYARTALATRELGLSQQETLDFTKSLNQAVALSGASSAEASAGLIQLSQGLASGALRGDELRSVLEQLPAVADVIAQGLGVTRGQLRLMGEEGQITADKVISAFALARDELENKFGRTVPTIGQALTVLKNNVIQFAGELDQATGASAKLASGIIILGNNLETLTKVLIIAGGAWVAYRAYAIAATGATLLAAVAGNVAAFIQLAATVRTVAQATLLLNAAFLTGPGALVIVLGAVAAAAFAFRKELEAAIIKPIAEIIILADRAAAALNGLFGREGKNLTGLTAEQLRAEADNLILEIANEKSGNKGTVSTAANEALRQPGISAEALKEAEKAQKAIDKVTSSLNFEMEQLKRNNLEQQIHNNLKSAGVELNSEAGQEIAKLTTEYEKNSQEIERQERLVDNLAGATEGFFKSALQGAEGFKGALKGLVGSLADVAFQMSVIEPIKKNLFGSGSSGGGLFGSIISGVGSIFSGGGTSAAVAQASARGAANPALFGPGFASGGSMVLGGNSGVDQNQLSLNGYPIARVGRGETLSVSPKDRSGEGIIINQTINVSTGVQQTVRAEMLTLLPEIQKSTRAAVADARSRGYD